MGVIRTFRSLSLVTGLAAGLASGQNTPPVVTPAPAGREAPKADSEVDSVIQLFKSGMSENLIIRHLRQNAQPIDISTSDLVKLQQAHVPEGIIDAMMDPVSAPARTAAPPPSVTPQPEAETASPAPPTMPSLRRMLVVTLPAGTEIAIRTIDAIDSKRSDTNKAYNASLDAPLIAGGVVIAPARATAFLRIEEARQAGKLSGSASLSLRLVALTINGSKIAVDTEGVVSQSAAKGKNTAVRGAGGAAGGAAIGGIAGGGAGAGIGAAAGATAGVVSSVFNKPGVKIPSETRLVFKLTQPVDID
jgi:hypothetical protein